MCYVRRRRAVCQEEVEKQLFTFCNNFKMPHATCAGSFIYEAALEPYVLARFASAHLARSLKTRQRLTGRPSAVTG